MGFEYAISKKNDGNMSFKWGDKHSVLVNRQKFLESSGYGVEKCVTVHTCNGTKVTKIDQSVAGRGMLDIENALMADAMITDEVGLGLFLVVADCAATIFCDPKKEVLCLAHLNGMNPGLIGAVLTTFQEEYGSCIGDLRVTVAPSISKASFVVPDPFQRNDEEWEPYIVNLDEHLTSIDMLGFLRDKMVEQGVSSENINISEIDTYRDMDYFSHRRSVITGEKEGRFAVVAKMT